MLVVDLGFVGALPVCVVFFRTSELITERRLKTDRRCSAVAPVALRKRPRRSLTFREYRSAPVGPISETELTSFSSVASSASIARTVAAVVTSQSIATNEKQTVAAIQGKYFISSVQTCRRHMVCLRYQQDKWGARTRHES